MDYWRKNSWDVSADSYLQKSLRTEWKKEQKNIEFKELPYWTWRVWTSRTMSCKSFSFPKVGPTNGQMVGWFSGARSFVLFSCLLPLKWWPNCGLQLCVDGGRGLFEGQLQKKSNYRPKSNFECIVWAVANRKKKIRKSHSICFTSAFKMGANFGSLALPHCLLSVTSSCREWSSFR